MTDNPNSPLASRRAELERRRLELSNVREDLMTHQERAAHADALARIGKLLSMTIDEPKIDYRHVTPPRLPGPMADRRTAKQEESG
jgi:hypothetical protein